MSKILAKFRRLGSKDDEYESVIPRSNEVYLGPLSPPVDFVEMRKAFLAAFPATQQIAP